MWAPSTPFNSLHRSYYYDWKYIIYFSLRNSKRAHNEYRGTNQIVVNVIVNPSAGRGRTSRRLGELTSQARSQGIEIRVLLTEGPGDAEQLAAELSREGCDRLAAMGGDGTFSEVINGLMGSDSALGLIPVGTGNDLARSLDLPIGDIGESLRILRRGEEVAIDVGQDRDRYFATAVGVGYPAVVAQEVNERRWTRGPLSFSYAFYRSLRRLRPMKLEIVRDGVDEIVDCMAVLVHNTPYTGGGLKVAPQARIDDGLLDLVIISVLGRLDLIWNFPRLYRGSHLHHPHFHAYRCREVEVRGPVHTPKTLDGEAAGTLPVKARVLPGRLNLILPRGQDVHEAGGRA